MFGLLLVAVRETSERRWRTVCAAPKPPARASPPTCKTCRRPPGTEAELKKRADDAQKALADAVSARASAQNELAELTKQVNEAKLAVSGAQEEATAKSRDLQALEERLKAGNDAIGAVAVAARRR